MCSVVLKQEARAHRGQAVEQAGTIVVERRARDRGRVYVRGDDDVVQVGLGEQGVEEADWGAAGAVGEQGGIGAEAVSPIGVDLGLPAALRVSMSRHADRVRSAVLQAWTRRTMQPASVWACALLPEIRCSISNSKVQETVQHLNEVDGVGVDLVALVHHVLQQQFQRPQAAAEP